MLQRAGIAKKAEQQRTPQRAIAFFGPAKPSHYAIAVAFMFHLEHDAFVGLVSSRNRFRSNAIQASSLKAAEPVLRDLSVSSRRSQMDRRRRRRNQLLQFATPLLERL